MCAMKRVQQRQQLRATRNIDTTTFRNVECESRNSHSYAVVVQDSDTQWLQAYPCNTKTSQETTESLQKFFEAKVCPNVILLTTHWNVAKPVEMFSGIIVRQRLIVPRQNGDAERAVRRYIFGTLQSSLDEKWCAGSMECYCYLRNVSRPLENSSCTALTLKHIDFVRRTNTTLDVLLESRVDDCWNVHGGREQSWPCTSNSHFAILNSKPPFQVTGSG